MKCCYLILAILTIASALSDTEEWISFKTNHGKTYKNSVEENYRFSVYQANLRKIEEHNIKFEQGLSTFKMGMNKFGDLTNKEFRSRMKKLPKINRPPTSPETEHAHYDGIIPARKDWRESGAVTPVKDQLTCGSCWAFSTVGSIESAHFIKTRKLVSFSEQVLVDCANKCLGCTGCWPDTAMEYVEKNGITTEATYPYIGKEETCQLNGTESVLKIKEHVFIKYGDERDLRRVVAKQPVSVSIDATSKQFQFYESGVLQDSECQTVELSHSVLVVGYGHDNESGLDYWLVKNSWGTSWGMEGYVKMLRNKSNQCGIASHAVYPVL